MALTFCHFLLLAWIFESLQIFIISLETLQKSQNRSRLMKNLTLGYLRHVLVLLHSLQDFSYIAFGGFICGIFVDLATDHTEDKWFETFHASPNHSLLIRKLSLANWWHRIERFKSSPMVLTFYHIVLCAWVANFHWITWNFAKMTESDFAGEKKTLYL